ncbi:glycoside hydrolase 15 protein [Didymosphaeria variabile]|uniref:Glucoamylase n=1 Tax=Didymosphaeria variabile TaxID=1932322 RepID=A0A9W9C7J6_9PLEO|nr:glycoside hydrolase 15 protein [Didymosphaeria variabile]KAJ4349550.1 glycoside hydrolase 15 protein [Didymosphaeria variabile]
MAHRVTPPKKPSKVCVNITNKSNIYAALWITAFLATVASLGYLIYVTPRFQDAEHQDSAPEDWLSRQERISINGILGNLGSTGAKAYGAVDGVLLDSPLPAPQDHPWTRVRDSNIVFKTLIERFIRTDDQQLQLAINSFITAQASIQTAQSPSGTLDDGKGLGEPRFLPNITADPTNRGRPKHDGPTLRAIALMTYGRWLFSNGYEDAARDVVWPILRNDLNYVAEFWSQPGLNFWSTPQNVSVVESFFITAAHHRALVEGAAFAKTIGETCSHCESQAPQILCKLQDHWEVGEHHWCIAADLAEGLPIDGRSGCDTSTLLSAISNFDPEAGCNDETFQPCSQPMLRNHKEVVDRFRGWDINANISAGEAIAIGRYPEDDHGNAWYPSTLAAAELLYASLHAYTKFGSITIGNTSLAFWTPIYASARTGLFRNNATDPSEVSTYNALYAAMKSYADGFVDIVRSSIPEDGSLAEQFSKVDGKPLGAKHFSWSYGAWLSMMDRREGRMPSSWSALDASHVPSNCSTGGIKGSYSPANNTQWPKFPCKSVKKVQVTFNVLRAVGEGEGVFVSGSVPELGKWDEKKTVKMDGERYDKERLPLWSVSVEVPAGTKFEYRYKMNGSDGGVSKTFGFQVEKETCWYAVAINDTWVE